MKLLSRWQWVLAGLLMLYLSFFSCAVTVVPGSPAEPLRAVAVLVCPALACLAFWGAVKRW